MGAFTERSIAADTILTFHVSLINDVISVAIHLGRLMPGALGRHTIRCNMSRSLGALECCRVWLGLDGVEGIDKVVTCCVATVQESVLAPGERLAVNRSLFGIKLEDTGEGFPLVAQLGIVADRATGSLCYNVIHHVAFGTFDYDRLRRLNNYWRSHFNRLGWHEALCGFDDFFCDTILDLNLLRLDITLEWRLRID